ncbi:hypothetical protein FQ087_08815 [Sporosarcina sp. ANT_H38]|uniref:hypothetical protein n=1 Tax=Sporosarcina sp. ANT_H38 TaxID=2597358 RepID=UPI0011F224E9|nr:hypothetical protein [Sporosarcina sp. ANT_H38]KAA0966319.1 hypothetical protein FQ087_08815 [Sporosarcina sp. ANT_H38]
MREEHNKKEGHHRGIRHGREEGSHQRGPKTFRRGRALAFLERMHLKRSTIKQQLDQPEFLSIQPILVGELKAIDMVISEFIQLFDINADEQGECKPSVDANEEGIELDEKN